MLYEIAMWNGIERDYTTTVVEAPAHHNGRPPQALVDFARETAYSAFRQAFSIATFQPARVGYSRPSGNGSAVTCQLNEYSTAWAQPENRDVHKAYWAEARKARR